MARRSTTLAAVSAVACAGVLAACGDPIQANRGFETVSVQVTVTEKVGNLSEQGILLSGVVVDGKKRVILGTRFQEECVRVKVTGKPATQYRCLALLNTGPKVYFAAGVVGGPFQTLKSLATGNAAASMTITKGAPVPTQGAAAGVPAAYLVTVALRTK